MHGKGIHAIWDSVVFQWNVCGPLEASVGGLSTNRGEIKCRCRPVEVILSVFKLRVCFLIGVNIRLCIFWSHSDRCTCRQTSRRSEIFRGSLPSSQGMRVLCQLLSWLQSLFWCAGLSLIAVSVIRTGEIGAYLAWTTLGGHGGCLRGHGIPKIWIHSLCRVISEGVGMLPRRWSNSGEKVINALRCGMKCKIFHSTRGDKKQIKSEVRMEKNTLCIKSGGIGIGHGVFWKLILSWKTLSAPFMWVPSAVRNQIFFSGSVQVLRHQLFPDKVHASTRVN